MGTAERRERERQKLRARILDAAREIFTKSGYHAVTMRKVATLIDYSPTTIYLHFADKDALLRELCTADFLALAARFRALSAERDPIRRLRAIGLAYLRFAQKYPNQYQMMFMIPHPPVAILDRQIEKGNPQQDAWGFLQNTVREAHQAGLLRPELCDPEVVAQLLFAGIHGVVALHIAKSNDPWINWQPVNKLAEHMIDSLLRGCGHPSHRSRTPKTTRAPLRVSSTVERPKAKRRRPARRSPE